MDMQAAQALVRFGFGRRGGETLPADPRDWLAAQLRGPDPAVAGPGAADGLRAIAAAQALRREAGAAAAPAPAGGMAQAGAMLPAAMPRPGLPPAGMPVAGLPPAGMEAAADPHPVRDLYRADAADLMDRALATDRPFRERLVWFWANHFTVSLRQGQVRRPRRGLRARGDPPARDRAVRRHAAGGDAPPGDADLPRQRRLRRPGQPRPAGAPRG